MIMKQRMLRWISLPAAMPAFALIVAGCGDAIENNPLFKDQQKIVARLDDDTKAMGRQVEDLAMTIETMKQVVSELKHSPHASLEGMKEFDGRLRAVETSMAEIDGMVKEKIMNLAKLELEFQDKMEKVRTVAASRVESAPAPTVTARVTKSSSIPEPAPIQPRGVYYKVKQGDTPETIAQANQISVGELLAANGIPQGGRLLAGQRIYVPAVN
jgi:LysM repeat protein